MAHRLLILHGARDAAASRRWKIDRGALCVGTGIAKQERVIARARELNRRMDPVDIRTQPDFA